MACSARPHLTLVSHSLCPYAQRAAIALAEKAVPFDRLSVDLAKRPDWFVRLSPLGRVPLLRVGAPGGAETVLFESVVILEYLEETQPHPLHPHDPLARARHRAWIEFGSAILGGIARFYNASNEASLEREAQRLREMFGRIEAELGAGPWFAGRDFSLVDAVYGPIFRYFDTFERIGDFGVLAAFEQLAAWRDRLAARPSIREAVAPDYPQQLMTFIAARGSALSARLNGRAAAPLTLSAASA